VNYLTIEMRSNLLTAQATGQQKFTLYPKSETDFFYKAVEAAITFRLNDQGAVEGLTLFQSGREIPASKEE